MHGASGTLKRRKPQLRRGEIAGIGARDERGKAEEEKQPMERDWIGIKE